MTLTISETQSLAGDQLYAQDLDLVEMPDSAQEQALIERARAGDAHACHEMITSRLRYVRAFALRYHATHAWEAPHVDVMELISIGNLALVEGLPQALQKDNPFAYVLSIAYATMKRFYHRDSHLIRTPDLFDEKPFAMVSLDAPISEQDDRLIVEVLREPEPIVQPASTSTRQRHDALYEAIRALPEGQRSLLPRLFGLGDLTPQFDLVDMAEGDRKKLKALESQKLRALARLRILLADAYAHLANREERTLTHIYETITLKPKHRERLDAACAQLLATHAYFTADELAKEACINRSYAALYLKERKQQDPELQERLTYQATEAHKAYRERLRDIATQQAMGNEAERERRLAQAYADLVQQGAKLSAKHLARCAHTNTEAARDYLKHCLGLSTNDYRNAEAQRRLAQAYEALLQQGVQPSGYKLAPLAHVTKAKAVAYLKQMRQREEELSA